MVNFGAIFTEYATAILLYLPPLELKYIVTFSWNFDEVVNASSSRLSWVSIKLKLSLFDNPITLNVSSKWVVCINGGSGPLCHFLDF